MNILIEIFFCDSFLAEAGNRGRGGRGGRRFKNRHRNGKIPKFIKNKLFPEWDGYDKHISPVPNDGRYKSRHFFISRPLIVKRQHYLNKPYYENSL